MVKRRHETSATGVLPLLTTCPRCRRKCSLEWARCVDCGASLRPDDSRGSMRTLFEVRGRTWIVRSLLGLALAAAAYFVAHAVLQ